MNRHAPISPLRRIGLLVLGALAAGITPPARADDAPTRPTLTDAQRAKHLESYDVVWSTVRDKHYDPKLNGVDWQAVRDEYRPAVAAAKTTAEVRAAITGTLDRLGQTHFGIIPSEAAAAADLVVGGPGETGLELRMLDGRPVVSAVAEGSPAAKAGVKPGWIVAAIRGEPTEKAIAAIAKAYAKSGMLAARQARSIGARLSGPIGSEVPVEFLDGSDKPVKLGVGLEAPRGVAAQFGNLPTFHVQFAAKRLDGPIGYVSLNAFFDPVMVMKGFAQAMKDDRDAIGLVIDLRGNPGGIGAMSMGMGGYLVGEAGRKLGTMITRDGKLNFVINPRPAPFVGPVAILVDDLSMSTSEILAGGLKDLGRARVFGVKTPGAALPSRIDVLPNGDRFQYAFANYISTGGKPLEGIGVIPDVDAPLTRPALLEGRDPALDAALAWIRSRPATSVPTPAPTATPGS